MPYSDNTVCSAWASEDDLFNQCEGLEEVAGEMPDGTIDDALLAASDALYTMSGRIFTGVCQRDVIPSYKACRPGGRVNLGLWPIHSIVAVTVGGVPVDPTTYTLSDFRYLQFTGEVPGGLTATVQYGMLPPLMGRQAAAALACELLAAFRGEECALPAGVTNVARQGISQDIINPAELLDGGRTGIYEVDRFLMIYNPTKIPSPSFVISPGTVASEHLPVEYSWPHGR